MNENQSEQSIDISPSATTSLIEQLTTSGQEMSPKEALDIIMEAQGATIESAQKALLTAVENGELVLTPNWTVKTA